MNEESSTLEVSAGEVRRSSNYEQVASGGYRRIGGSVHWSGGNSTADMDSLAVIEVTSFGLNVGEIELYEDIRAKLTSTESLTTYTMVMLMGRANSTLVVIEKDSPTEYFTIGEAISGDLSSYMILAENPELTDTEYESIQKQLTTFGLDLASQPSGTGRIAMVSGLDGKMICARYDGGLQFYQSTPSARSGVWLSIGDAISGASDGVFESFEYTFAAGEPSLYIVNGTSDPMVVTSSGDVSTIEVADVAIYPSHVIVHQNHLFLGYDNGAVIHSDLGDPTEFTGIGGAAEFNVGFPVTGFQIMPGESLAIFGENQISVLSGTSTADWQLDTYSNEMGAIAGTIQNLPTAIFASIRGISTLSASDNYGDFSAKMLSHNFARTYRRITTNTQLFSLVNRESSQYRLINANGRGLYLTFSSSSLVGAMEVDLKHDISCVGTNQQTGELFFGTEDGWVHRMDEGNTFAGVEMGAFLEFPYHHHKSPRQKKRFKEVIMDIKGDPSVEIDVIAQYERGRTFHCEPDRVPAEVINNRSQQYKKSILTPYDQYFESVAYTTGTGTDQSLIIEPTNEAQHEIDSITTHYTYRGQRR